MEVYSGIGAGNLTEVNCPFCSSAEAEQYRSVADIVKCGVCGSVFLRTRLKDRFLENLYQSYTDTAAWMIPPEIHAEVLNSPLRRDDILSELSAHIKPGGSILDIGCGWGAFLHNAAGKGFRVEAVEISTPLADYGREKLNLNIINGRFPSVEPEGAPYDAVTMIHTLQHITDPVKSTAKVFNILKPGGIFAGAVPNIDSFASETLGNRWEWIDPYHHTVHYYPEFLSKFLVQSGFEIINIYTVCGDFNRVLLGETVRQYFRLGTESAISAKIAELEQSNKGEEIRFIVRKKQMTDKPNNASNKSYLDKFRKVHIAVHPGDNYEELLFNTLISFDEPVHIIVNDPENCLPESALNWNGVTVIRGKAHDDEREATPEMMTDGVPEAPSAGKTAGEQAPLPTAVPSYPTQPATGKMPSTLPKPLALNLGCGNDIKEGYVNIDLFSNDPSVVRMDIRHLELPDGCADFILASDILEHFSHRETVAVLREWARVLKPGAELMIRCPSLRLQVKAYQSGVWDADIASYMIFGGQTNPGDFHCIAFDEKSIVKHLQKAGMEVTEIQEHDKPQDKGYINLNMTVRARKPVPTAPEEHDYRQEIFGGAGMNEEKSIPDKEEKIEPSGDFSIFDFNGVPDEKPSGELKTGQPQLNIVWEGSQFVWHSLALINREHCYNIVRSGTADLTIIPYEKDNFEVGENEKFNILKDNDIRFKEENTGKERLPYAWIRHQWPPKAEPPRGAKWIIMQPWEYTTHRKDFVEIFSKADEIWTPSTYSRQSFINSGIDFNRVQVVPNGIDPLIFKPTGNKYPLATAKKFKLLFVGGTIYRKGIDILLKVFKSTFTGNDNIALVIKDMGGESFYKGQNAKEYIDRLSKEPGAPEIIYIDNYLDEEGMAGLYRACDLFVCPYRGEGFSLPTLEAMACGLPVVVTEGGATDDFVRDDCGWKVPATLKSIGDKIDNLPMTGEAFLLEPDASSLSMLLKSIYADPTDVFIKGVMASWHARTQWTWERATVKALARLDFMFGTTMAKEAESRIKPFEDPMTLLGIAESKFEAERYDEAVYFFNKALAANMLSEKAKTYALNKIALCYYLKKNFTEAENYVSRAGAVKPGNPDTNYILALLFGEKNDWESMLEILSGLMDNWSKIKYDSSLGFGLDGLLAMTGCGLREFGDLDNAVRIFSEALKINPNNYEACYGAALCFRMSGMDDKAREMLEWALKIKPDYGDAKNELQSMGNGR